MTGRRRDDGWEPAPRLEGAGDSLGDPGTNLGPRSGTPSGRPRREHLAQSPRTNWDDPEPAAEGEPSHDREGRAGPSTSSSRSARLGREPRPAPTPQSERARHRRNRALTTIGLVLLALFFAFWFAYSYYRDAGDASGRAPVPTCRPASSRDVTPATVKVNVYNATNRAGLAKSTSEVVADLGFQVGDIANDPLKRKVAGPAEVRFGPKGKAGADILLAVVGKGAVAVQDTRKDATVDLVLGTAFVKLGALPSPTGLPVCTSPAKTPETPAPQPKKS